MNKPSIYILPILVLLQSCATPLHAPAANPQQTSDALSLKSYKEYANVYIRRDYAWGGSAGAMTVDINNQSIGELINESYFNIKILPGTYTINTHHEEASSGKKIISQGTTAEFSYKFKAGEVILIQCTWDVIFKDQDRYTRIKGNILTSTSSGRTSIVSVCWGESKPSTIRPILKDSLLLAASVDLIAPTGYAEYNQAKKKNTVNDYQSFVTAFPASSYTEEAQISLDELHEREQTENWNKLSQQQQCTLQHEDWLYLDKNCKNRMANGKGRAVYIDTRHSFNGLIKNGQFISGKYLLDGDMLYDGQFKNAKPSGNGVCLYKGALEECKYYNGERVDSLYKHRVAILEMEERQQKKFDKLSDEISSLNTARMQGGQSSKGNAIGDALVDEAINQGMEKLFDSLF